MTTSKKNRGSSTFLNQITSSVFKKKVGWSILKVHTFEFTFPAQCRQLNGSTHEVGKQAGSGGQKGCSFLRVIPASSAAWTVPTTTVSACDYIDQSTMPWHACSLLPCSIKCSRQMGSGTNLTWVNPFPSVGSDVLRPLQAYRDLCVGGGLEKD
jgi:hypothetical protein